MRLRKSENRGKFNSKVAFETKQLQADKLKLNSNKSNAILLNKRLIQHEKISVKEIPLNNKVLRLRVKREDLKEVKRKLKKEKSTSKKLKKPILAQKIINKFNSTIKLNPLTIELFKKDITQKLKMVVNNGKVSKYDPDDFFLKRLKSKKTGKMYCLKPLPCKPIAEGKLNYKFHQLVNDVKNMQLPTSAWKIKVIIRHNKIAAIIFTNKAELERSLSFNSNDDKYHIVIDNKPALLLGSPGKVNSCSEIEVLLGIMETIEKDSPLIMYK